MKRNATPKSYPVGKVNLLDIYPLTFDEFLEATDESLYRFYCKIQKELIAVYENDFQSTTVESIAVAY